MSDLWKQRFESETHDKWCYAIIDRLASFDASYISSPIDFKKRIKNLNGAQSLAKLYNALTEMQKRVSVSAEFTDLLKRKVPVELLIEYIGAPEVDAEIETKSVIYNRLSKNHQRPTYHETFKDKVGYMIGYAAFAASFTFGAATTATLFLPSTHPISEFAHAMGNLAPSVLKSFVPQGNAIYNNAKEFSLALFASIGLYSVYTQWTKGRSAPVELNSRIAKSSNSLAEEFYSYNSHKQVINTTLEGLTTADKHLLSHLSPYEIRTILTSTPEVAKEILDAVRPSFAQRENAFASNESYFSFIGHMMEAAVLPSRLRKPIVNILESFSQVPLAKSMGTTFQDSFDSSSSFAQRLNKFRQVPSAQDVSANNQAHRI